MSRDARNREGVLWKDWLRTWLSLDGQKTLVNEHRRLAEVGCLLEGVGPAEQVAILPFARGDFHAEGESVAVPATRNYDGRYTNHVYPTSVAMRTAAHCVVLGHGLVDGRHLNGGVNVAIEVEAVERFVVYVERSLARNQDVCLGLRVVIKLHLGDGVARIVGSYFG